MEVNEGMQKYIIQNLERTYNLKKKTIGLLGLTFKADSDDIRDSLAIKLLNYLKRKKIKTLYSDEFFSLEGSVNIKDLINRSDIIIISSPHKAYKKIKLPKNKVLIDIWGHTNKSNF